MEISSSSQNLSDWTAAELDWFADVVYLARERVTVEFRRRGLAEG
jgi:hypothetical protein